MLGQLNQVDWARVRFFQQVAERSVDGRKNGQRHGGQAHDFLDALSLAQVRELRWFTGQVNWCWLCRNGKRVSVFVSPLTLMNSLSPVFAL